MLLPSCLDASAFSGVELTISGSVSGCVLQWGVGYAEDVASSTGSCTAITPTTCHPPEYDVLVTVTPTTVQIPWAAPPSSFGAPIGNPDDPAGITGFNWQFAIPAAQNGGDTCVADVNISGLKFYH
jgi:hypothetical protein